jgi:hypothetical protein
MSDLFLNQLVSGGDDRLTLDAVTQLNLYGHGPLPKATEIAMGSSTASTISIEAFRDLEDYHARLRAMIDHKGGPAVYEGGTIFSACLAMRTPPVPGLTS